MVSQSRPVEITIKNDEAKPTLALEIDGSSELAEDGDTGTANGSIVVKATLKGPGVANTTTVALSVSPVDSTRAYLTSVDQSIEVLGNAKDSEMTQTLNFTIVNDGKFFEDLELTITGKAEGFDDATATVTVLDDDQDVTLSLDVTEVTESKGEDQEVQVTGDIACSAIDYHGRAYYGDQQQRSLQRERRHDD